MQYNTTGVNINEFLQSFLSNFTGGKVTHRLVSGKACNVQKTEQSGKNRHNKQLYFQQLCRNFF